LGKFSLLSELIDLDELQTIQDNFAKTAGISSIIFSPAGEPLTRFSDPTSFCALIQSTEEGKRRCFQSFLEMGRKALELKKPRIQYCFACGGHFVAPIIINGIHKGTMFGGQFIAKVFSPEQLKKLKEIAQEINIDPDLLIKEAKNMRLVDEDVVWNYSNLLFHIVEFIAKFGKQAVELRKAKDTLQKSHDKLEIRVRKRTAELAKKNEQLKQEIAERRRAEQRIEHLNSVLKAIKNLDQLILVVKDRDDLLQIACDTLIEARRYNAAWLGFLQDAETFLTVKGSCFEEDVSPLCENIMQGVYPPCIKNALTLNDPLVVVDKSSVCGDCFFKNTCAGKEAVIIRVEHAGRLFGLLAILLASDVFVDQEEKELLVEVAEDIAFALQNMEIKKAHEQAEETLRQTENQLHEAQKMEAIGTLAGGIAHDFNNLLMGIQGRTSLMLMDYNSDHPHYKHLRGIENIIKRGADLTRQLLGFARGGKYEVKPTDINDLIGKCSEMFGRTKKEIRICGKYQKDIRTVDVDQGQIEQVLLNLYVNAWQAMPKGGELYLETENVTLDADYVKAFHIEPGNYVKISVTDNGIGMDEATCQRIFEPFFTTKGVGKGTGLGLASAYGIIKNHKGIINVNSEKEKGTTFSIYLPASGKKLAEEKQLPGELLKGAETVLFVDDEDMISEVGETILKELGYKVLLARNGKEAIEVYSNNKNKIDLVILDMILPEIGGDKAYEIMKDINPDIKVLLSSGYSVEGDAAKILERGCDGFIQKPFNMKQLSKNIREVLDRQY
jgi:signal transduction histidine kinase/ligand-binding sensor protein/ActR/RegA family two-component response regulator